MKQKSAVVVVATLVTALLLAPMASADEKSKKAKKVAQASTLTSICKPTSAVGHSPKRLAIPSIKRPHVNKIITLKTNCGEIQIAADGVNAPLTVISMTYLANKGYFDNSPCHRLTTQGIFVLQCGDPAGDGTGGPGFSFADENLPTAGADGNYIYPRGTVAMANSGPNTNGSQFFLVYKDSPLPPNYSVWGNITAGLDVLDNVASAGVLNGSSDGLPSQAVVINKASTTP